MIEARISVLSGARSGRGHCRIDGTAAEVDLPDTGGRPERIAAAAVPVRLARLVGLGPRPVLKAPGILVARATEIDQLLGLDGTARARDAVPAWSDPLPPSPGGIPVPGTWREPLARIVAGRRAWWWLTVTAAGRGHDGGSGGGQVDRLEIVDAGDAGLWVRQQCLDDELAQELERELEEEPAADPCQWRGLEGPATALTATTPTAVWAWLARHMATCT